MSSPANLYVLTDANGFSTCIAVSVQDSPRDHEEAMLREMGRTHMMAPITCFYWRRIGFDGNQWRLINTWEWSPHGA